MTLSPQPQSQLLVVDDDPAIAKLIARFLAPHGYVVQGVENETDALELLCDPRRAWGGVILDATLPLMQHGNLVKAISDLQRDLPVIVTSALDEASVRLLLKRFLSFFLEKPFGTAELLAVLTAAGIRPKQPNTL